MDITQLAQHLVNSSEQVEVKQLVESDDDESHDEIDPMEIATTVTIVEEDGTTSVVEGAQVSSVISDPGNSSIRFGHSTNGNVTYQLVSTDDVSSYQQPTVQLVNQSQGQYYVVSPRSQVIDARSLGRFGVVKTNARDDKKRATHNEVERRRRDKINGWIGKLAKIVPACVEEGTTTKNQSKGGILAKACEYISELKNANCRLASTLREHANTAEELDTLRREVSELRKENMMLKQQLGPTEDDSTVIITTTE